MPRTITRPEVHQIAEYLKERKNTWVMRQELNRFLGVSSGNMESLMVSLEDTYPYICEEDRYDGCKRVRLMWRDWDEVS